MDSVLSHFTAYYAITWSGTQAALAGRLRVYASHPNYHQTLLLLSATGTGKTAELKFLAQHLRLKGDVDVCTASWYRCGESPLSDPRSIRFQSPL